MSNDAGEISRLEQSNVLGLAYLKAIISLNGGGVLALLTYFGNASAQTIVSVSIEALQRSLFVFVAGISAMMFALLISYSFTASAPGTRWKSFWDRWIILLNTTMALVSLLSFAFGSINLVLGIE